MGPIRNNAVLRVGLGPIYWRSRNPMKCHDFPVRDSDLASRSTRAAVPGSWRTGFKPAPGGVEPVWGARYEPLGGKLCPTPQSRGRRVHSRTISRSARSARVVQRTSGSPEMMAAGGSALHTPVLGRHAIGFLNVRNGGVYIDGTLGAGGYTSAILSAADCKVIGIDRDQTAIALGADLVEQAGGRLTLIEDRFSNLETIARDAGHDLFSGVVFDLGVSSMQLDSAERGFSFRLDGPLDMRMSAEGPSAA